MCLALPLAACGGGSSSSGSDTTSTTSTGTETFTFGVNYFSEDIDPSNNVNSAWQCQRLGVGETLFKFDSDGAVQYCLCDEATTDDYITWELHIREGVTFSNGNELTASAVCESWDLVYDAEANGSTSVPSQYLAQPEYTADDETNTITVVCQDVTANLDGILAYPYFVVIDMTAYEEDVITSIIGTGPYVLTEYVEATSKTFEANENYWGGDVPYAGFTAVYMDDSSTKAMAIQSGDVDVVENITTTSDLETLEADDTYTIASTASARVANTYFNFDGIMSNDALRQAIQYAIDDETMCSVTVGGIYTSGYAVVPSSVDYGYDQLTDPYAYDADKAVEVLDDAGIVDTDGDGIREIDGENIELVYLAYESRSLELFAEAVATTLEAIGIGVDYQVLDYDTILGLQSSGDFDMVTANTVALPTGEPTGWLGNWYSGNSQDYGNYSNDEYDALYEQLLVCTDDDEMVDLCVQMQQILLDDAATIVHGYYNSTITYNNSVITGVEMYPLDYIWVTSDWAPVS